MNIRRYALLLALSGLWTLPAQSPTTFRYFYDDAGQLYRVLDSTGTLIQYTYDPSGNIIQVSRSSIALAALSILNITPAKAPTGTTITIQGQGFSTTPSANLVIVNGLALTVVSATSTTLVVQIPGNATTGAISVTVGGVTATSPTPETIEPIPSILTLAPKATLAGTPFTLSVTGANLTGATFSFSPPLTITSASINAGGTSATLVASPAASAKGYYTLIGTNTAGSSSAISKTGFLPAVTAFNTISIPGSNPNADPDEDSLTNAQEIALGTDPLNADTDGDSYVDGLEVLFGSNPLDPKSIPSAAELAKGTHVTSGLPFSILNSASPASASPQTYAISGLPFSILNSASPATTGPQTYAISGIPFSILNSSSPATTGPQTYAIGGLPFSILNSSSPATTGPQTYAISGLPFSMLNSTSPATSSPQTYAISGFTYSILNGASPAPSTPRTYAVLGPTFSILNGTPAAMFRPVSSARSLRFQVPVDPAFIAEALARGAARTADGKPVCLDSDGDGLCDSDEWVIGTNPFIADTDGDGYPDGLELALGSDPLDPNSVPNLTPPGYFASPPVSIHNIAPIPWAVLNRQGGSYARKKK